MQAINLVNSSSVNDRVNKDFYPTPPNVTHALMGFLNLSPCTIWEPACGDGAMSTVLESYGHNVVSTDIREDSGFGIGGVDFLTAKSPITCDAIITNPPFAVADQFIRRSIKLAPIVAMLLKSQYWHAEKRTKLFAEHPPTWILALNWRPDFLNGKRGGSPIMECLWTVWERGKTDTRYRILTKH